MVDKKNHSPDVVGKKIHEKKGTAQQSKLLETKMNGLQKNVEDKFDIKLN